MKIIGTTIWNVRPHSFAFVASNLSNWFYHVFMLFCNFKIGFAKFFKQFLAAQEGEMERRRVGTVMVVCELQKTSITFGQLTRLSCIWLMYSLNVCVWMTGFKHKCNHKNSTTTWNNLSPRFKRCATAQWILYTSWGKLLLFLRALAFKFESCVNLQKKICTPSERTQHIHYSPFYIPIHIDKY